MNDARAFLHDKHFDSCVSRCYYALYHLIIALLEKHGISSKDWGHAFVSSEFGRIFIHRKKVFPKEFSAALYIIQAERNKADYDISPVSFKKATRVFDKTGHLWNTIYEVIENAERKNEKRQ